MKPRPRYKGSSRFRTIWMSATAFLLVYLSFKNWRRLETSRASLLSVSTKRTRWVIVCLVNLLQQDIIARLRQLDGALLDDKRAEIVLFHDDFPSMEVTTDILSATSRRVHFVHIGDFFWQFPKGFDPYLQSPSWAKRSKWGYQQMIKFFFRDIFHLEVFHDVKYIMRFDDDSCFPSAIPNVFQEMEAARAVYYANEVQSEVPSMTYKLEETAREYVASRRIIPPDTPFWQSFFNDNGTLKLFYNNFEVCDVDFFLRKEVQEMSEWFIESQGIYRHRWGDAPLRYMTLAMFADPRQILARNFAYRHPC